MSQPKIVRFYLHHGLKQRAERGEHPFLHLFCTVLRDHGFHTLFHLDTLAETMESVSRQGYSVFLMQPPTTEYGLTIRKNYFFPFWKIEKVQERWDWPVAKATFDPKSAPRQRAERFASRLRTRLFGDQPTFTGRDGLVYVPLQGRLLQHRSFQSCSPITMLENLLAHEPERAIVATLRPSTRRNTTVRTNATRFKP